MKRNWVYYRKHEDGTIKKIGRVAREHAFWLYQNDTGIIAIQKTAGFFKRVIIKPSYRNEFADYLLAKQQLLE